MDALFGISGPKNTTTAATESSFSQPPLQGVADNSAVLQRITELETLVKSGFDRINSKLANTVISVSATPMAAPVSAQRGGRKKTRRSRRTRSKCMY
jgi:hypothetical protein